MNKYIKAGKKFLTDKNYRTLFLSQYGVYDSMDDEAFLKMIYKAKMGKELNLDHPQTFNEKLNWLKIHDHNPLYTKLVDKYEVKKIVGDMIGNEHIIPTLGVWDSFDEIDFNSLPDQFVLKCTHDSGGLVICRDKSQLDLKAARKKINYFMKRRYFSQNREWPYKNVKHRIIAEQYMEDSSSEQLYDYKFFCFGGTVKCMKVDFDRFKEHHANYFDKNGQLLGFGEIICPPKFDQEIELPGNFTQMIDYAEQLTAGRPFLRADFYDVNGQVYFGELTFYPASGMGPFTSEEWDYKLGDWIHLPDVGGVLFLTEDLLVCFKEKKKICGLTDYKFYCFGGKPEYLYVSSGLENHKTARISFLTLDWEFAEFGRSDFKPFEVLPKKPEHFGDMVALAEDLAQMNKSFIRVDMYEINKKIYFSELTFFPCSGMMPFQPEKWDLVLGKMISLR